MAAEEALRECGDGALPARSREMKGLQEPVQVMFDVFLNNEPRARTASQHPEPTESLDPALDETDFWLQSWKWGP